MALTPEALPVILTAWGTELSAQPVAIDGKALRGRGNGAAGKCLVHVLRAWVDAHRCPATIFHSLGDN